MRQPDHSLFFNPGFQLNICKIMIDKAVLPVFQSLLLDILFPPEACCLCRKPGHYSSRHPWCEECAAKMAELHSSEKICVKCGRYLEEDGDLCRDCRQREPSFDLARAAGPYCGCFRLAIRILKFMGRKYLAPQMGKMMAETVRSEEEFRPLELVVPVPISPGNLRRRGFNQAELLGSQISRDLKIKMDARVLKKIRETPDQVDLGKQEREVNLQSAFAVEDPKKLQGKNILLVDDVFTTGSTARECTKALLDGGAARVCVVTWATGKGF